LNRSNLLRLQFVLRLPLIIAVLMTSSAFAQVNIEAYRDYFLVGQFGEVCTMCEVVVVCERGSDFPAEDSLSDTGDYLIYHLQTRTFWSQISTIWEWFISNFTADALAARGHTRPVHVYTVVGGIWSAKEIIEGRLVLDPGVLEFGDYTIDRVTRAWQEEDTGARVGYCSRLPLWDTLETIAARTPQGDL